MAVVAFLLIFPSLLTGCWNNRDLVNINIVAGLGLDRTEDGKILLTIQVVEPAAIQSTVSNNREGNGSQQKPVFVVSYEGETVSEALRGVLAIAGKKMFLSTAQVLIFGERLLQDGIEEVLDFFQRENEMDYGMDILVAKDATPKEILEIETDIDSIPILYIKGTIDNTNLRGTVKKTILVDLLKDIGERGIVPVIGGISIAGEKEVRTEGIAVIKDGRLAGWLGQHETMGYMFATDKVKSAIVNVPADNGKAAIEIIGSKGKVNVVFKNGKPYMLTVKVKTKASVGEYKGKGKLDSPDKLYVLEKNLEEEIKKEIMMTVEKAQKEYSSDIFGFGVYVRKYHPQYWKKVEKDWNDIFSKLPVDIQVTANIMRTGIIKCPINKDE